MNLQWAIASVIVLLATVTWLASNGMNPAASRYDVALAALDKFDMAEGALRRDVLSARAGLLHNYDPVVREGRSLLVALGHLRDAQVDAAVLDPLSLMVDRQDSLIEQFKSDNALLQQSLSYFALLSSDFGMPNGPPQLVGSVSALAGAMLRLTLDRSPASASEVMTRLDDLARLGAIGGDREKVAALLAHGRLLQSLLPETDQVVRTLYDLPRNQTQAAVRASIVAHQQRSREIARQYRAVLYGVSLLLLAAFAYLGQQLRRRALLQRRRAEFERMIAGISMSFISSHPSETATLVRQALAELAQWVHADRGYFLAGDQKTGHFLWHANGADFPAGWPDGALAILFRDGPQDRLMYVPDVDRSRALPDRDTLLSMGVYGWTAVAFAGHDGNRSVLGFDSVRRPLSTYSDEVGLLRIAFDVMANAITRDILWRERTRLATRLRRARRMETVGAFASGIAHNFNNIVGTILGYAEMADAEVPAGQPVAGYIRTIRQTGERASQLIDQILAFGRPKEPVSTPVSLRLLMDETELMLRASLPEQICLRVGEVSATARVLGEPAQLQQVILNLCNNAAQAMGGAGTVTVTTTIRAIPERAGLSHSDLPPGHYVCIGVQDTGHGMSPETLERIFEPFFTTRRTGNGLGLATVYTIVKEHGGAMNVRSTEGEGSLFEVWLPLLAATESAPHASETIAAPRGRGEAILLVDDDPNRLLRDEEVIAALGYEVIGFAAAADALAACRAAPRRFDAIVIGHLTPRDRALELATRLREAVPHLPVLLAASAEEVEADDLATAGVFELAPRPMSSVAFAAALTRCLAERRSAADLAG